VEVVGQIGIEGHAVPRRELVLGTVAVQDRVAELDEGRLPAAGLVHRGIAGPSGLGARLEPVARELGSLAGQRRSENLVAVALGAGRAGATLTGADDLDRSALVEAQQLGETQVQTLGDPRSQLNRWTRLPALDLREHRRADLGAQGQVPQGKPHGLTQRADARTEGRGRRCGRLRTEHTLVSYHVQRPLILPERGAVNGPRSY
jgi:hypothetical protein